MDGIEPVRACFCERLQVFERSVRLLGALLALSEVSTSASRSAAGLDGNPDWFNESQIFVACRLGFIAAIHLWLGYMCALARCGGRISRFLPRAFLRCFATRMLRL